MKKILTVLTILVILVSAVFADPEPAVSATETHTIKLKTNVGGVIPAFNLEFTSGTAVDGQASSTNGGENPVQFSINNPEFTGADIEVLDISRYDISAVFTAKLANEAKQVEDYRISFSAGPFNVKKDTADATVLPESVAVAASGSIAALKGVSAGTPAAVIVDETTGTKSQSIGFHFNGTTCVTGDLATFSVSYAKDPEVDPTAARSYYYANITMTVEAI